MYLYVRISRYQQDNDNSNSYTLVTAETTTNNVSLAAHLHPFCTNKNHPIEEL